RQDALRQVDTGAALAGLVVQLTAGRREMTDVGDVDAEQPVSALVIARQGHGIVEVAGIDGIDGDGDFIGKVLATAEVVLPELPRDAARLRLDRLGELV